MHSEETTTWSWKSFYEFMKICHKENELGTATFKIEYNGNIDYLLKDDCISSVD